MSVPPIPPPLEHLGQRPFSFYPPIVNTDHNEWVLRRGTWSEILVANTKTAEELWIPRRFLGEISRVEEPVMILGLTKELEYTAGQVLPHIRRVIEIPRAVNEGYRPPALKPEAQSASVVGIRVESSPESRVGRLIGAVLVIGIVSCVLIVSFFRGGRDGSRVRYEPVIQSDLGFSASDDYHAIVRKLGLPAEDQWRSNQGEIQYRVLRYPKEGMTIVLMGTEREKASYIGALDSNWRPIHSISLPGGGDTSSMLRSIKRF